MDSVQHRALVRHAVAQQLELVLIPLPQAGQLVLADNILVSVNTGTAYAASVTDREGKVCPGHVTGGRPAVPP